MPVCHRGLWGLPGAASYGPPAYTWAAAGHVETAGHQDAHSGQTGTYLDCSLTDLLFLLYASLGFNATPIFVSRIAGVHSGSHDNSLPLPTAGGYS